jgi:three-Cys-motif partner protein
MTAATFFDESADQSQVKTAIVAKYFWAWAHVIIPSAKQRNSRIAYVDLFAGPGRYKDGTKSTPLLILEQAIADPDLRQRLVTIFNDLDSTNTRSIEQAIRELPGIEKLKYPPEIHNEEVGAKIVAMFERMTVVPTFFFVDPWGYKGLSLRLINSVLKNWGCDCIFFFNYNRINMGLSNQAVREHMDALFGQEAAERLRHEISVLASHQRELAIVEAISESLQELGGKYVLPFRFRSAGGDRTSHHLIFVSKHFRGYEIMKSIMAKESSSTEQGVPSFEYNPALKTQGLLFELNRPLDQLGGLLLNRFAGQRLTMKEIYEAHNVGTRFIKQNYKTILLSLEREGKIKAEPPLSERKPKNSFADHVRVTFPQRS